MVKEVAFARTNFGIGEGLVYFEWFGLNPFAVFPIESLLCDFADVDFGVEVSGEGFVVVAGVAVDDVEIVDFVKVVFGRISGIDARDARVEATAQNGGESGLLKALFVGPLP